MLNQEDAAEEFGDGYSNERQRTLAAVRMGTGCYPEASRCRCDGNGWILTDMDVWVPCCYHRPTGPAPD